MDDPLLARPAPPVHLDLTAPHTPDTEETHAVHPDTGHEPVHVTLRPPEDDHRTVRWGPGLFIAPTAGHADELREVLMRIGEALARGLVAIGNMRPAAEAAFTVTRSLGRALRQRHARSVPRFERRHPAQPITPQRRRRTRRAARRARQQRLRELGRDVRAQQDLERIRARSAARHLRDQQPTGQLIRHGRKAPA